MMRTRRTGTGLAAMMVVAALALGACGSDDTIVDYDPIDTTATGDTTATRDTTATGDTTTGDTTATGDTTGGLPGAGEGDMVLPGPGVPAVQLRVQGLFPVTPPFLPTGWTTIYADGTVLLPSRANAFAQPQVWPYEVGHLETIDVAALFLHADGYGLFEEPSGVSPAPMGVADPPRTTLVLTSASGSVTHTADGLGLGTDPTDAYREVLMKLTGEINDLVNTAAAKPADDSATWPAWYEAEALDVTAVEVTMDAPGPGTNQVVEWGGGDVDLATWTSCTTVDDPSTVSFLVGQLAGPMFQQGDHLYRIASRVHPPGTSCT